MVPATAAKIDRPSRSAARAGPRLVVAPLEPDWFPAPSKTWPVVSNLSAEVIRIASVADGLESKDSGSAGRTLSRQRRAFWIYR